MNPKSGDSKLVFNVLSFSYAIEHKTLGELKKWRALVSLMNSKIPSSQVIKI